MIYLTETLVIDDKGSIMHLCRQEDMHPYECGGTKENCRTCLKLEHRTENVGIVL